MMEQAAPKTPLPRTLDAKKDNFNPFHNSTNLSSGEMTIQRNIETPGKDEQVYMRLQQKYQKKGSVVG